MAGEDDIFDQAAARGPKPSAQSSTATLEASSDEGDVFDQAAARPIPPPLNLGPSKDNAPQPPLDLSNPDQLAQTVGSIPAGVKKALARDTFNAGRFGATGSFGSAINMAHPEFLQPQADEKGNKISTEDQNPVDVSEKPTDTPEGAGEAFGGALTGIGEFVLADQTLQDLTIGDKYNLIGKIHKALETSPKLQRAMELGIQATRQGAAVGVQQTIQGATPGEALERAGVATLLGMPVGQIAHWTPELLDALEMAQQNKYVKTPADMLVRSINPPEEVSLGRDPNVVQQEYAKFDKELKSNLPYIIGHVQDSGEVPIGRRSFVDALVNTSNKFRDAYTKVLNPNKEVGVMVSRVPGYSGAFDKDAGIVTLGQLDSRLNDINDIMMPAFDKGKGGLPSEAAVGSEVALRKEASAIRKTLYSELQTRGGDATGINVAETKARNGQLRDLADQAERQWQKARVKANTPLGDLAPTPYRAAEAGGVRAKRNLIGDPRDIETRSAWKLLEERGDHGLQVGAVGPEPPPATNAFVERTPGYVNIPERPTDIVWENSTPEEIAAHREKLINRSNIVKNARAEANKQIQRNRASHGPRGEPDATGEP